VALARLVPQNSQKADDHVPRLITSLPLEYDTSIGEELYGKISFYSLRAPCRDRDRCCDLLGISPILSLKSQVLHRHVRQTRGHRSADVIRAACVQAVELLRIPFFETLSLSTLDLTLTRGHRSCLPDALY
jgi:hypothetical protein